MSSLMNKGLRLITTKEDVVEELCSLNEFPDE